jgi:hypothetical protein
VTVQVVVLVVVVVVVVVVAHELLSWLNLKKEKTKHRPVGSSFM